MKPLKKGYESSEENVHVKIAGKIYRCANLKKGGIMVQSKILLAHLDEWHEVDIIGLGADKAEKFTGLQNSNLQNFKTLVETKNLSHNFLSFSIEESVKNYNLTQDDRIHLDKKYGFSYVYIEKLEDHLKRFGHKTGEYAVSEVLKYLKKQGRTIQEYIATEKLQANEIINNSNKLIKMSENTTIQGERIEYLTELGFVYEENPLPSYVMRYGTPEQPARFEVSLKSIEEDSDEDWNKLVERIEFSVPSIAEQEVTEIAEAAKSIIQKKNEVTEQFETENPAPLPATLIAETPTKKPVSLSTIGSLTPDRISEFTSLKENQEKVVKDNPFIEPTDKASFEKAKKAAAALLKASTAIDSPKDGIKASKSKFLKQLNTVLDNFLDPLAKMTRTAYDKQNLANEVWKNKEALRIQNEEKEKLAKVNARTQSLFDVPMVFNGTHYTIGTLHIMPSQITSATDEDFNALVVQAKGIKAGLDAAALVESEKDKQIAELKAMLEKLTGATPAVATPAEKVVDMPAISHGSNLANPNTSVKTSAVGPTQTATSPQQKTGAPTTVVAGELTYSAPSDDNKLLLAFDLENLAHVEKQAFLKCRSYYIKGLQDAGKEIVNIFENPAIPKKAEPLKELGTILKNS